MYLVCNVSGELKVFWKLTQSLKVSWIHFSTSSLVIFFLCQKKERKDDGFQAKNCRNAHKECKKRIFDMQTLLCCFFSSFLGSLNSLSHSHILLNHFKNFHSSIYDFYTECLSYFAAAAEVCNVTWILFIISESTDESSADLHIIGFWR